MKIKYQQDVNEALGKLRDIRAEAASLELAAREERVEVDRKFAKKIEAAFAEGGALEKQIEAACRDNPDWFDARRSLKLANGKVGFKATTAIELDDEERTAEALKKQGLGEYVTERVTVAKAKLVKLGDDVLALIGARRKTGDSFTITLS